MSEFTKKQINFILTTLCIIIGLVLSYFFVTTVLVWLIPFIIAFIISRITEPAVVFMERKMKFPRKLASAVSVVSTILLLGALLTVIIYRIVYEVRNLADILPDTLNTFSKEISNLLERGNNIYIGLPSEISKFIDNAINSITNNLSGILAPLPKQPQDLLIILPPLFPRYCFLLLCYYFPPIL